MVVGIFNIHVNRSLLLFLSTVHAGICASMMLLLPEDCMITSANIFPILSLVLILLVPTKNDVRFVLMLQNQWVYQLAIKVLPTTDSEEELGKYITSLSETTGTWVVIE